LEGQVIPLKLPFLVLEKQKPTQKRKRDSGNEEGDGDEDGTSSGAMTVLGIARKKIMFKSRPNPRA
jgi:Ctf8